MFDLDKYAVPQPPSTTVLRYLHDQFRRGIVGLVNLWSQFFCTQSKGKYSTEEKDTHHSVIE